MRDTQNMESVSTQRGLLKHRLLAIDVQKARRCAPLSWRAIEDLMARFEHATDPVSDAVQNRLMWHLQAVERQLDAESVAHAKQGDDARIQWPALRHDSSQALASWQSMREWHARFQIRHQLQRSLAQPLQHAGPLHSARLVQQSLSLLNGISPAYLHRLLSQVDALAALEDAGKPRVVKPGAKKAKANPPSLKPPA
jgi:hypothetical protein